MASAPFSVDAKLIARLRTTWSTTDEQKRAADRLAALTKQLQEQRALSEAYLRLRVLIGDEAFKTPHAPTAEQVWNITEAALVKRLAGTKR